MRKAALVAAVLLLAVTFTAAWFALGPTASNPKAPQFSEDNLAGTQAGDPLTAEHAALPGDGPDGTTASGRHRGTPAPESGDSRPVGFEAEGPTATGEAPVPPATAAGAMPNSGDAGEPARRSLGEVGAPALPFIKGHDRPPGQNLGNTRPVARAIGSATGVKALSDVTPKLMQDRRGLYAEYFRLNDSDLSKLDTSSPDMVRIDRHVYFPDAEAFSDLPIGLESFAAVWEGFLVIPEQGDYWLFWGADNGGRVELDGQTVLLQDGMVRYVEVSAVFTLQPGLHPLKIEFAQFKNNVADWSKCAASFMWVPQGQTKPVPVPPEMLMVPEWMWSDNAPIITSLSRYEGEIGDEITIHGQGFGPEASLSGSDVADERFSVPIEVCFAGQSARILERSDTELRVIVPIGAKTGSLIVKRSGIGGLARYRNATSSTRVMVPVPSNSMRFIVTTQFGLLAEWHNLEGWSNFGFEVFGSQPADVTRLEGDPGREDPPGNFEAGAVRWTGRLGIPENDLLALLGTQSPWKQSLTLSAFSPCRLIFGGQVAEDAQGHEGLFRVTITPEDFASGYKDVRIEVVAPHGWSNEQFPIWFLEYSHQIGETTKGGLIVTGLSFRREHYFPPVVPPKPPKIHGVEAVWPEGGQSVTPPYDVNPERPAIAVGQEFKFLLTDYSTQEEWAAYPSVSVDGIPLTYVVENEVRADDGSEREMTCTATMPEGVGEGRIVARQSIVSSEPVFVDVANRGLVAYLYDFPDAGGLAKLPDLGPLYCFKVRKDRTINFETAADFDLPFPAETFVIEWLGGLIIEEEGDYTFTCRSDDGMKLWLDDNVVLDADKLQAPAENSATVHLEPGTYRFRMQFFENNQHEVCVLEWAATRGDGSALETLIPRAVIPAKAFTLDVHPPFPNKTSTGKRTDGS